MNYLHWDEQIAPVDASEADIAHMYEHGYVFTRIGKGVMHQTRSVRIDLSKFELSSENRRILKKMDGFILETDEWLPKETYKWEIAKMAKDFYDTKFGPGIMSVQKVKEMLTDIKKSNFNNLLVFWKDDIVGYAITYTSPTLLHYSYPFYDLKTAPKDMGLGMMTMAIQNAKIVGRSISTTMPAQRYVYLGSLQRPSDTYKLQFTGLEWFDGGPDGTGKWRTDTEPLKALLKADV